MKALLILINAGYRRLSSRGRRVLIAYASSLVIISGLDGLALYLMARIVGGGAVESDEQIDVDSLITLFGLIVALFLARSLLSTVVSYIGMKAFAYEEVEIGKQNLEALQDLPWSLKSRFELSDYYGAVDRGPTALVQGVLISFATLVAETSAAGVILLVMLWLQPVTAMTAMAFFLSVVVFQHKLLSLAATRAGHEVTRSFSTTYDLLGDRANFSKILEVMPSSSLDLVLGEKRTLLAGARSKVNFIAALPRYFMESILAIGLVVVSAATYLISGKDSVVAALIVFAAAGFRLLPIINRIQGLILQLFATAPLANEGLGIHKFDLALDSKLSESNLSHVVDEDLDSSILFRLQNVSYRYPGSINDVLKNVSFSIDKGKQYAIVGRSGSGKTTLVDIMLGLLSPTDGSLGVNSKYPDFSKGYVPQESMTFSSGVLENVALEWKYEAIDIQKALQSMSKAQIESAINGPGFPEDSYENHGKVLLSGGQRQRLGLARSFYRDSDFLVLDESTSALDMSTEHEVMKEVNSLRGVTTVVIVAHRLSTIQNVDQVIYLESGRLVSFGTFQEVRNQVPEFENQIQLGIIK
jgi:ABC-type multidrug transport system fused ATPase/permease subunit